MNELIFHPESQKRLDRLRSLTPQSLLLHGEVGVGLLQAAKFIAGAGSVVIAPEGETQVLSIKTERIRQLYDDTKGRDNKRRFVIIDDADQMTQAAQSAFLKLLEEPNRSTYFILTSHDKDKMLPTILSRLQTHYLPLPTRVQTKDLIDSLTADETLRQKITFLAPNHPSIIYSLLNDKGNFDTAATLIADARSCIQATSVYNRQVIALKHATNREEAIKFIDACIKLLKFSLQKSSDYTTVRTIERYLNARSKLERNSNTKLIIAHLMI